MALKGARPDATRWALVGLTALAAALAVPAWTPSGPAQPLVSPAILFECGSGVPDPPGTVDASAQVVVAGCPMRFSDVTFVLSDASLALHPTDAREYSVFALHGTPMRDGPTNRSRTGQMNGVFATTSDGWSWSDTPSPEAYPSSATYGESSTGGYDSMGGLYFAHLWSDASVRGAGNHFRIFHSPVANFESSRAAVYGSPLVEVSSRAEGGGISALQLRSVPASSAPTANESANGTEPSDPFLVITWHESSAPASENAWTGWMDAAWSREGARASAGQWDFLADSELVGPCRDGSRSVVHEGSVYFLCVAAGGYLARDDAQPGEVDLWRIDPTRGTTEFVSATGLHGGHPSLAVNPRGHFVALTTAVRDDDAVDVEVAFGWNGQWWERAHANVGDRLHERAGALPVISAHVTGVALSDSNGAPTAFLIYEERNPPSSTGRGPGTSARLRDYQKIVMSFDRCDLPLATGEFTLGTSLDTYASEAYNSHPGVFEDLQDGFEWARMPNGDERIFFAVADYGSIQYGRIDVPAGESREACEIPPPPPPPASAAPQANPSGSAEPAPSGSTAPAQPSAQPAPGQPRAEPPAQPMAEPAGAAQQAPAQALPEDDGGLPFSMPGVAPGVLVLVGVATPMAAMLGYLYMLRRRLPVAAPVKGR